MNCNRLLIFVAFLLIGSSALTAKGQAKFDLSVRQSLFFTGADTTSLDAAEQAHLWVNKNASMTLKTSQAVKCDGSVCYFNIGDLVWRDVKGGPFTSFAQYTADDGSVVGNSIVFANNEEVKTFIMSVKMHLGKNKVTLTIDPENKTLETNEANNSLTVYFNVLSDKYEISKEEAPTAQQQAGATVTTNGKVRIPQDTVFLLPNLFLTDFTLINLSQVKVTVKNMCKGNSAATTLRLDVYGTRDRKSAVIRQVSADVPALKPNESQTITINSGQTGDVAAVTTLHFLKITLDPDKKVPEVQEGDNTTTVDGTFVSYSFPLGCGKQ